jgi:hypothetical protein
MCNMDFVIYSEHKDLTEGMFGQALTWLLEVLRHLETSEQFTNDSKIVFDINTKLYDNLVPTYIVPHKLYEKKDLKSPILINLKQYKFSKNLDYPFHEHSFTVANYIFQKYFTIRSDILKCIPELDFETTLGVHYRGTDKQHDSGEANIITQEEYLTIIDDYLQKNSNIKTVYCCSDEATFINKCKQRFYDKNIVQYSQKRSSESYALHKTIRMQDETDKHCIAAIVDMISLSRCNMILKTSSALSAYSKIINPQIQLLTCCAMKQRWFPTGVVKSYTSSSVAVNDILSRTMQGHVYCIL